MNIKKVFIPIAILLFTAVGFYSLVDTNMQSNKEYIEIIETARDYSSRGILDDAVKYYEKSLEYKVDEDIYIEYVQVYVDNGYEKKAMRVAEEMVKALNDSEKAYECLLDRYIALEDFDSCFALDDEVTKRKLKSNGFAEKMANIEYAYELDYQTFTDIKAYANGYAAVCSNGLYGIVDESGNVVLGKSFLDAGYFSYYTNEKKIEDSGFVIPVCDTDGRWMYISSTGNKKIEIDDNLNFDNLGLYIDNGLIAASSDGIYAYYDTQFQKQFGEYLYAGTFNCGRSVVQIGENEWYVINENGDRLNEIPFLDVVLDEKGVSFRNNRAFVLIDSDYYMIDVDCNIIGEQKYINAQPFIAIGNENSNDILAAVCINGKWGFVDVNGEIVLEPQYANAHSFSNGFAAVESDDKWGFIDVSGNLVIDFIFSDVKDFNGKGCVYVNTNKRWSLMKLYRYNH